MRVLLVEDDAQFSQMLATYLDGLIPGQVEFFPVVTASEATRALSAEKFDAVILDLTLPDSTNPEITLDSFREIMGKCPTIVVTGLEDFDLGIQAIGHGARDFICKTDLNKLTTVLGSLNRKGL